jgi:hypothetical protein
MPLTIINGPVIAAGESLSEAIDCSAGTIVRITMPAAWSRASLTFEISSDGQGYNQLVSGGSEVSIKVIPGAAVIVPNDVASASAFIKFRSGRKQAPVPQPVSREFAVALRTST